MPGGIELDEPGWSQREEVGHEPLGGCGPVGAIGGEKKKDIV